MMFRGKSYCLNLLSQLDSWPPDKIHLTAQQLATIPKSSSMVNEMEGVMQDLQGASGLISSTIL